MSSKTVETPIGEHGSIKEPLGSSLILPAKHRYPQLTALLVTSGVRPNQELTAVGDKAYKTPHNFNGYQPLVKPEGMPDGGKLSEIEHTIESLKMTPEKQALAFAMADMGFRMAKVDQNIVSVDLTDKQFDEMLARNKIIRKGDKNITRDRNKAIERCKEISTTRYILVNPVQRYKVEGHLFTIEIIETVKGITIDDKTEVQNFESIIRVTYGTYLSDWIKTTRTLDKEELNKHVTYHPNIEPKECPPSFVHYLTEEKKTNSRREFTRKFQTLAESIGNENELIKHPERAKGKLTKWAKNWARESSIRIEISKNGEGLRFLPIGEKKVSTNRNRNKPTITIREFKTIIEKLKEEGLSQNEIAKRCQCSPSQISKTLRLPEEQPIGRGLYAKITTFLGVS